MLKDQNFASTNMAFNILLVKVSKSSFLKKIEFIVVISVNNII